MQKDMHFYLTYAVARKVGLPEKEARLIAWADQFTDELTEADLYGLQTQCETLGNWSERQVQMSVLVPFHFLPGDDAEHPWKTTQNSSRARKLAKDALNDPIRLGISLHVLQDTFSHQGFSGWREDMNSCFPWYFIKSSLPNVGHAEMRAVPDIVNQVWTDPRDNRRIDNKIRALAMAKATFDVLSEHAGAKRGGGVWKGLGAQLKRIFKTADYDERKEKLRALSGNKNIRCSTVSKGMKNRRQAFIRAANDHLSAAIDSFPT